MSHLPKGVYRDVATHADPSNFARRMKAYARQVAEAKKAVTTKVQPIRRKAS